MEAFHCNLYKNSIKIYQRLDQSNEIECTQKNMMAFNKFDGLVAQIALK